MQGRYIRFSRLNRLLYYFEGTDEKKKEGKKMEEKNENKRKEDGKNVHEWKYLSETCFHL